MSMVMSILYMVGLFGEGLQLVSLSPMQVTVEATLEHPFFVFGQGWSSVTPDRTLQRYGLPCHKLSVGDVCVSLTHAASGASIGGIPEHHPPPNGGSGSGGPLPSSASDRATQASTTSITVGKSKAEAYVLVCPR
jgi:hypothetical protein